MLCWCAVVAFAGPALADPPTGAPINFPVPPPHVSAPSIAEAGTGNAQPELAQNPPIFYETSTAPIQGISPELQTAIDEYKTASDAADAFNASHPNAYQDPGPEPPNNDGGQHDAWAQRVADHNTYLDHQSNLQSKSTDLKTAYQNNPNVSTSGVSCAEQLDPATYALDVAGVAVELGGTIAESVAALDPTGIAEVATNIAQGVGLGLQTANLAIAGVQLGLPNCEGVFTGSVETYANFIAKTGVSAHDGAITLGYTGAIDPNNPNLLSEYYYDGITLGGGGLGGAGAGGAEAYTGHRDAIAIGNGAIALNANDTALGTGAHGWQRDCARCSLNRIGRECDRRRRQLDGFGRQQHRRRLQHDDRWRKRRCSGCQQ